MILKRGSKGHNVEALQEFLNIKVDGDFGDNTHNAVIKYQKSKNIEPSGVVNEPLAFIMGFKVTRFDEKYKGVTIQGSHFPDKPIDSDMKISLSKEMTEEYLPVMEEVMSDNPRGFKLLITAMAHKEGFYKKSRSYRTNNPGNIGNTDSGDNKKSLTLRDGILRQKHEIGRIVMGEHAAYPMGEKKVIKPYFSEEIAKNPRNYGMSPYVPGYEFTFIGQLDQFVKIYATGARAGNKYISTIISYFAQNGIILTAKSKIQDIIYLD